MRLTLGLKLESSTGHPMPGYMLLPDRVSPAPIVVLLAGHNGFVNWSWYPYLAERLRDAGLVVVSFDFSLCGVEFGQDRFARLDLYEENSPTTEITETLQVVASLRDGTLPYSERLDTRRIGLYAHSLGGGVALCAAAQDSAIGALALWSSISTIKVWPESAMTEWRKKGRFGMRNNRTGQDLYLGQKFLRDIDEAASRFNIIDAAKRSTCPILLVHGEDDRDVPVSHAHELRAAAGQARVTLELIPGTGHTYGVAHPLAQTTPHLERAIGTTVTWLTRTLKPTVGP